MVHFNIFAKINVCRGVRHSSYFTLLCPVAFLGQLKSWFCVFKHFGLTKEEGGFGLLRGGNDYFYFMQLLHQIVTRFGTCLDFHTVDVFCSNPYLSIC